MKIPIKILKAILNTVENTIYPSDQTTLVIPMILDFESMDYSGKIKTIDFYFIRNDKDSEWSLESIAQ